MMKDQNSTKIILALGSNLGDRSFNIKAAIDLLTQELQLENVKKSTDFANAALLKTDAPADWNLEFINCALSADIDLAKFPPQKILQIIKKIEEKLGRTTQGESYKLWAPRLIDIDILALGNLVIDEDNLKIPHIALLEREFFLKPFCEIEPEWKYPIHGKFFGVKICEIYPI